MLKLSVGGNPLVFHFFRGSRKFGYKGGYPDFPSKVFCLRVPQIFVVEPFCAVFQKISGSEKS